MLSFKGSVKLRGGPIPDDHAFEMMARQTLVIAQVVTGLIGLDPRKLHLRSALRAQWALSQLRQIVRKFRLLPHGDPPLVFTA
jgi:hypothetical protein